MRLNLVSAEASIKFFLGQTDLHLLLVILELELIANWMILVIFKNNV